MVWQNPPAQTRKNSRKQSAYLKSALASFFVVHPKRTIAKMIHWESTVFPEILWPTYFQKVCTRMQLRKTHPLEFTRRSVGGACEQVGFLPRESIDG